MWYPERTDAQSQLHESTDPRRKSRLMGWLAQLGMLLSAGGAMSSPNTPAPTLPAAPTGEEEHEGIEVPPPTYAFGAMGPLDFNQYPVGPSQAQLDAEPIIEQAMNVSDPWAKQP
jgi:hypothetical protein